MPAVVAALGLLVLVAPVPEAGAAAPAVVVRAAAAGTTVGSHQGVCTTADPAAVTVVVDYQDLGGAVDVRCATNLPAGATGYQALQAAGFAAAGTARDGSAFVCRLNGRPAAGEVVPIPGNAGYTEQCQTTPPASAYWSYWYAPSGGSWAYSTQGVMSRRVQIGGFEGWSFAHNAAAGSNPAPRFAPVTAPAPPAVTKPPTTPSAKPPAKPAGNDPATRAAGHLETTGSHEPGGTGEAAGGHRAAARDPSDHPPAGDDSRAAGDRHRRAGSGRRSGPTRSVGNR